MKSLVLKLILLLWLYLFSITSVSETMAQGYTLAAGLRLGETSGFTLNHYNQSGFGFEGIIGIYQNGLNFTLLAERCKSTINVTNLSWYYGGGGHMTFYNRYNLNNGISRDRDTINRDVGFGIDAIVGLEYNVKEIPIVFNLGIKPFIEFDTEGLVGVYPDLGLGIKFILK